MAAAGAIAAGGGAGAVVGATGTLVAGAIVAAMGITVSAAGASIVVVQPHSTAEYVTVVMEVAVGTSDGGQVLVWWQPQSSS